MEPHRRVGPWACALGGAVSLEGTCPQPRPLLPRLSLKPSSPPSSKGSAWLRSDAARGCDPTGPREDARACLARRPGSTWLCGS